MSKKNWESDALISLDFFENNPEYKGEFGHKYFADRFDISRMTLSRNKKYMKRYGEVNTFLKGIKVESGNVVNTPIVGNKEKIEELNAKIDIKDKELDELKLRLNDCYQMLEDQGIDPQFVYKKRMKKHKQA
jgi:chromosome condensin MukBEF ATPase and DNA-binding subunit MukB